MIAQKTVIQELSSSSTSSITTVRVVRECKCHARTNSRVTSPKKGADNSFDFMLGVLLAFSCRGKQNFKSVIISVCELKQLRR